MDLKSAKTPRNAADKKNSPRAAAVREAEEKNRLLAVLAARAMHEQRADDVVVLDARRLVDYADFLVIGSAGSAARMRGVVRFVEKVMHDNGAKRLNHPDKDTVWVLADFGDILVHMFGPDARDFYRLEELWADAPRLDWQAQ